MRALMLHNRYQWPGGEDISCALEIALLRSHGWEVTAYEETNDRVKSLGGLRTAARTIWSAETYHRVRSELRAKRYDVVHVQNFFALISPSAYYAARAEKVPVVQTLRNYRLLCPASTFMRQGRVCEDCSGKWFAWPGVYHACYRDSASATAVVAAMLAVHRSLGTWSRAVDAYIALTSFGRDKFVGAGLPANKMFVKPNYLHPDPGPGPGKGGYAVFVGRLDEQKGIPNLLAAWQRSNRRLRLRIIGDGPLAPLVAQAAATDQSIEWQGRLSAAETLDVIGNADFLVLTSESYEGQPRVVVEAFAKGTPAVISDLGAMSEMVESGETGILFRPREPDELAAHLNWAMTHPDEMMRMRPKARAKFEADFTPERNYRLLMDIYDSARLRAGRPPGG